MRKVKFSPEYQLTFSLLNADPIAFLVDWDINSAVNGTMRQFIKAVSKLYDMKINTQIQYFATLAINPDKTATKDGVAHILRPRHLPHFLNSEWSFGGSPVSTNPPINLVVYIPSRAQSPMYISETNEKSSPLLETNGFLIPQWGGIVIVNPSAGQLVNLETGAKLYTLTASELEAPMQVFLAQIRTLLGVKETKLRGLDSLLPAFDFSYARSAVGITMWELDRLTRLTTLKNLRDAASTLKSLVALIESLENMVILDHIREEVSASLEAIHSVRRTMKEEDKMTSAHDAALQASRIAITSAERAFFDPTMVSLLYFPDEQKLAVYLPLLLPVAVPLLSTLMEEVRKYVKKRREGKRNLHDRAAANGAVYLKFPAIRAASDHLLVVIFSAANSGLLDFRSRWMGVGGFGTGAEKK
ncbi:hypothetical protein HDU84_001414 [Entophlyctis sp. JEL0112]|nr:hypothetical protein HDU84_001414 [Entophlyctis sp. JEL0112]